jgi:hypothetical protein
LHVGVESTHKQYQRLTKNCVPFACRGTQFVRVRLS